MKTRLKFVALTLALVLAVTPLAACKNDISGDDSKNSTSSADNTAPADFVLKSSEGQICRVCYSDDIAGTPYYSTLMALVATLEAKIGAKPDTVPFSQYSDNGTPTLFICGSGSSESEAFMKGLKYSDYGYAISGNDLCLGANTAANFSKAVKSLTNLVSKLSAVDGVLSLPADTSVIERGQYSQGDINGASFDSFSIVYADESLAEAAADVAHEIGIRTGAVLPVKLAANSEVSECEILIGNVGREATNALYAMNDLGNVNYKVAFSGKTVSVVGESELALECGANALRELVSEMSKTDSVKLTDASSFAGTIYENEKLGIKARPEGTDIRIGGNNIYFHQNNEAERITTRDDYLYQSFIYMDADILLLQEVNPLWHKTMDTVMQTELGYTVVPTSTDKTPVLDGRANYTPIWYRAEKLELLDYGYKQYETVKLEPDAHLSSSKSYTWALFKDKAKGGQVITITTHFTWAPENFTPTPDQCRVMDAKEVMALVAELEAEYAGVPIVLMGDLNCTSNGNPYNVLYEKFKEVDSVCEQKNEISKGTTHSVGSTSVGGSIIDHTLYIGDKLNFKMYQHVYNEWSFNSTDHIPLLLDVQFK